MQLLDQALTMQANGGVVAQENLIRWQIEMVASKIMEFLKMNPLEFGGSQVEEHQNDLIDEFYKVVLIMGVTSVGKVPLASCQLKEFAQLWYEQWKSISPRCGGSYRVGFKSMRNEGS